LVNEAVSPFNQRSNFMKSPTIAAAAAAALAVTHPVSAQTANVRGIDHVGINVPDLDAATAFFTSALGCQAAYRLGPFKAPGTQWMAENIDAHPEAELVIQAMRCANGANLELFSFRTPRAAGPMPRRDEVGATSIGFYVDDLPLAIAQVKSAGGTILGEVKSVTEGPIAGESWVYAKSPWGFHIFLMTAPDGTANDKNGTVKLWSPRGG
jgi:catechol 2,3-dioxygenase-like lactoylglutathione lyase family enzyme